MLRLRQARYEKSLNLLDNLPSHDEMLWDDFPDKESAFAFLIGNVRNLAIYAYLKHNGNLLDAVGYVLVEHYENGASERIGQIKFPEVQNYEIRFPFSQIKGSDSGNQKQFNSLVIWYFMAKGGFEGFGIDPESKEFIDFCNSLVRALGSSDAHPPMVRKEPLAPSKKPPKQHNIQDWDAEPGPSTRRQSGKQESATITHETSEKLSEVPRIKQYLQSEGLLCLLDIIPPVGEMEFSDQQFNENVREICLKISRPGDRSVFAYVHRLRKGDAPSIRFVSLEKGENYKKIENPKNSPKPAIFNEDLRQPFNKCYSSAEHKSRKKPLQRLEDLIAWYFIAYGKEKKNVTTRASYSLELKNTLLYVRKPPGAPQSDRELHSQPGKSEESTGPNPKPAKTPVTPESMMCLPPVASQNIDASPRDLEALPTTYRTSSIDSRASTVPAQQAEGKHPVAASDSSTLSTERRLDSIDPGRDNSFIEHARKLNESIERINESLEVLVDEEDRDIQRHEEEFVKEKKELDTQRDRRLSELRKRCEESIQTIREDHERKKRKVENDKLRLETTRKEIDEKITRILLPELH